MHETPEDVRRLQALLDRSYAYAGSHLLSIHTPERRLSADQVVERLTGMCLLSLATVTADCRPVVGPVDSVFYRGRFLFGSSAESVRMRHLALRPQVSATHTRGEELAITVHGTAELLTLRDRPELQEVMVQIYGEQWRGWGYLDAPCAFIEPDRMFTFAAGRS